MCVPAGGVETPLASMLSILSHSECMVETQMSDIQRMSFYTAYYGIIEQ